MTALQKTKELIRLDGYPLSLMDKQKNNPNKMTQRAFDLLCDNMEKTGWTDPTLCVPVDFEAVKALHDSVVDKQLLRDQMVEHGMRLRIVGGHHRFDAGAFLGFEEGPVTVIMDPDFDEDAEQFQIVRMNVIRGKLDPNAFMKMFENMSEKYSEEIMQDSFGFADDAEWQKLIAQTAKALPDKHTQEKFKEAAKEIQTVEGLHKLLNHMINTYGDTMPYGFMVFDHAGQRSVWVRIEGKTMKAIDVISDICIDNKRTLDDVLGTIVQLIARGDSKEFIKAIIADTPEVKLPKNLQAHPTKDHIEKVESLAHG